MVATCPWILENTWNSKKSNLSLINFGKIRQMSLKFQNMSLKFLVCPWIFINFACGWLYSQIFCLWRLYSQFFCLRWAIFSNFSPEVAIFSNFSPLQKCSPMGHTTMTIIVKIVKILTQWLYTCICWLFIDSCIIFACFIAFYPLNIKQNS